MTALIVSAFVSIAVVTASTFYMFRTTLRAEVDRLESSLHARLDQTEAIVANHAIELKNHGVRLAQYAREDIKRIEDSLKKAV